MAGMTTANLRFKVARIQAGYTQLQLAELAGVREFVITRVETGRSSPPYALKERLAQILRRPTYELFQD